MFNNAHGHADTLGLFGHGLLNVIVVLGMAVVIPLGMRLINGPGWARVRRVWVVGAVPGAVSLWLPRGWVAAALATCYVLATGVLLAHLPGRLMAGRLRYPSEVASEVAAWTALAAPTVASR